MNLNEIQNPEFLKSMKVGDMYILAQEIRSFLIESISKTGGHLASNLGVVELTIALHYVFNSPEDKIFFDVGHQCYTHKILTGRAAEFSRLRQFQGLSGFEKRKESEHDVWEAGHSSTSLSAAIGMAVARDAKKEHYSIVPVIGDGALSSGMALEALNQIGSEKRNIIIIFNDNNMSISKNVGALSKGFARLRAGRSYNQLKQNMKKELNKNNVGKIVYSSLKSIKDAVKESVIDQGIFGEFNLEYMGPVDGHNISDLIQVLNVAKEHDGPVVVHVLTQKGKGYKPCENDREGQWHGVGPFNPATGKILHDTPVGFKSWSALMSDTAAELAEKNENIVAVTPAMIYGSSLEKFFAEFPDRSFDCGIAEEHAATFCAGMAISGLRPYLAVYSSFMQRCYDQINHDICRMDLPVVIGVDHAGLVGSDGETHHGVFDIGFLKPLPNIIIAQPKDAEEARNMMFTAFSQQHPFAIRYPKGNVQCSSVKDMQKIEIGTWEMLNDLEGSKAAVFTYGEDADKVLNKVSVNNLSILVVNCRFFKPIDIECIKIVAKAGIPVYIYETDMKEGGLGSSVLESCCDLDIKMEIIRLGISDHYVQQGSDNQLRKSERIDMNTLFDMILKRIQ